MIQDNYISYVSILTRDGCKNATLISSGAALNVLSYNNLPNKYNILSASTCSYITQQLFSVDQLAQEHRVARHFNS